MREFHADDNSASEHGRIYSQTLTPCCAQRSELNSLPLNRRRRFAAYVMNDAGYPVDLVDDASHFVLEQLAQGLDELELQVRGQSTHNVLALDEMRLCSWAQVTPP